MPRRTALLIGVSECGKGIPSLPATPNDAAAMQRVLVNPKLGAFDEVKPLINPDLVTMQREIRGLFTRAEKEDLILLFFSGHGITDDDNRLYLTSQGTSKDDYDATSVPAYFIQNLSKNSYSKQQVIILDCCYSGAFAEGWLAKSIGVDLKKEIVGSEAEGRVVLTSSTATQTSFQQEEATLSLYTQYLVEGIETGAADEDRNGIIYVRELHRYAKAKVQQVKPKMKPDIILDREGYNIRLAYAPRDSEVEYRQLVEQYAIHGEISEYRREFLKLEQKKYGISDEKAEEVLNSVLEPFRRRLANLTRYEEAFRGEVKRKYPLDKRIADDLRDWQQFVLGLEDEDIAEIQQQVAQQAEAHQQNLARYQQAFCEEIEREFPITQVARSQLQQLQQLLQLSNDEISQIEQPIVTQKEAEYQQCRKVERIQQELEVEKLHRQQEAERLRQQEAERLQQQQEVEYRQKLQQYEQELVKIVEAGSSLKNRDVRQRLRQLQRDLGLKDTDITAIEARVVACPGSVKPPPPIKQSSHGPTSERTSLRINRKQFLKWAGFGGAGLVTAVVTREIFQFSGLSPKPISLQSSNEIVQTSREVRRNQLNSDIRAREQRNNVAEDDAQRADRDLESEVRSKLEANIPKGQLAVQAKDGAVIITGSVPNQQDMSKIEPLAKEIKGVKSVDIEVLTFADSVLDVWK